MRIETERLILVPITLEMFEAVYVGDRARAELLANARLPDAWPGRAILERAFSADIDLIREDPPRRLWGDRLMISRGEPRIVGSVIFHGRPEDGIAEVGYGVELESQGRGFATEATRACVDWALAQPECVAVTATTFPWHKASLRVIEKLGMTQAGSREHDLLGELFVFEKRR
ncbi:MAG: acetyltransferase, family [Myxococcales bacterium]|nr:acetyltransferase, family [Myxococcales bacterium]